jgi:hypothetical protein
MVDKRISRGERNAAKEQEWRELFAEQTRSGLPVARFCQQRGIQASVFYYWRKELARREIQRKAVEPTAKAVTAFAQVAVTHEKLQPSPTLVSQADPSAARIVVALASGERVELSPGFDPASLRAVMAVLRGASC